MDDVSALVEAIQAELKRVEDAQSAEDRYSLSADATKNITKAAFEFAAKRNGNSSFQASWVAARFFAETLGIDSPFAILAAEEMMVPGGLTPMDRANRVHEEFMDWCSDMARKKMSDADRSNVNDATWSHWEKLASHVSLKPPAQKLKGV